MISACAFPSFYTTDKGSCIATNLVHKLFEASCIVFFFIILTEFYLVHVLVYTYPDDENASL